MLQYKLETLEGLSTELAELYEEKDGAYFLKVSGAVPEDDLQGLKASRDALLAEKKEQQRKAEEAERVAKAKKAAGVNVKGSPAQAASAKTLDADLWAIARKHYGT